jgi:hypothetical protein
MLTKPFAVGQNQPFIATVTVQSLPLVLGNWPAMRGGQVCLGLMSPFSNRSNSPPSLSFCAQCRK